MASMDATVIVGLISLRAMDWRILPNSAGFIPAKIAASSEAHMQDVPDADSQLKLNMAAYLVGTRATGGMRRISLCSPGHAKEIDTLFRIAAKGGKPQASTKTTSSA